MSEKTEKKENKTNAKNKKLENLFINQIAELLVKQTELSQGERGSILNWTDSF